MVRYNRWWLSYISKDLLTSRDFLCFEEQKNTQSLICAMQSKVRLIAWGGDSGSAGGPTKHPVSAFFQTAPSCENSESELFQRIWAGEEEEEDGADPISRAGKANGGGRDWCGEGRSGESSTTNTQIHKYTNTNTQIWRGAQESRGKFHCFQQVPIVSTRGRRQTKGKFSSLNFPHLKPSLQDFLICHPHHH